jgi:hypothetical protein
MDNPSYIPDRAISVAVDGETRDDLNVADLRGQPSGELTIPATSEIAITVDVNPSVTSKQVEVRAAIRHFSSYSGCNSQINLLSSCFKYKRSNFLNRCMIYRYGMFISGWFQHLLFNS